MLKELKIRMKYSSLALLISLLLLTSGLSACGDNHRPASGPELQLEADTIDVGTVLKSDSVVNVAFKLKNTGDMDLRIYDAASSCTCTQTTFPRKISAGKTDKIEAQIDVTGYHSGRINVAIAIYTNIKKDPDIVRVLGKVRIKAQK